MNHATKLTAGLLCIGLLAAACHGRGGASGGRAGQVLRIAFESMPSRLDPRFAADAYASRVNSLVFASLLSVDRDGSYRGYLAADWGWEDDLTCTFTLRDDFVFHDGSVLTADDVVATYTSIMAGKSPSPRRATLAGVSSLEARGRVVRFHLEQPDAAFLEVATLGILPAAQAAAATLESAELIGAGPYRIAEVDGDKRITLQAFAAFPLFTPSIASIEIRHVPDALMRALELRNGTIDFVQNAIDPDTTEWLARHDPARLIIRAPSNNFQYIGMNLEHPALADVRVRRAIAYAIDRQQIVRHLLKDQARVASGLLPAEHWAYTPEVKRYGHDPARARRLLDRAGIADPDGPGPQPRLRLSYKTTTVELRRRIAEALAEQLAKVGIELEILTYEWGTFFADIRSGNFDLYSLQWVGIVDPDIYRQVFHSQMIPPAGNNRGHYRDPRMDRLSDRGRLYTSSERRRRIYARVQKRAARRLPYIPLWWPQRIVVATRGLQGFLPHPAGDLFGLSRSRLRRNR